jgi:transmembrane sensor
MKDMDEEERAVHAERAAAWLVTNESDMQEAERQAFLKWLKRSPQHIEEYLGVASVARDLRKIRVSAEHFPLDELVARAKADNVETGKLSRSTHDAEFTLLPAVRWFAVAASLTALGVVGLYGWSTWNDQRARLAHVPGPSATLEAPPFAYRTPRGQQRTARLPDGSVVHLNTDTAVVVHYSAAGRKVTLLRGQADFDVVHDPQRAFTVSAGHAEITDVGTKFDVNLEDSATVVTVVEGAVEVAPAPERPDHWPPGAAGAGNLARPAAPTPARPEPVRLSANQQVTVQAEAWPPTPKVVDAHRTTAWLRGQMVFDDEPLERVAAEFNRYAPTPIEIVTPALRRLQVSGVFATDDPESFIAFLRTLEGVRVEVTPTRIRVF